MKKTETDKPVKKGGRLKAHYLELPIYDSLMQMAGATGIPLAVLKHAKRNGCLFVVHGRCNVGVFLKWFFAREVDGEEDIDWGKREKRAAALTKEVSLEKLREQVIDFELAKKFITYLVTVGFFSELERMSAEFPASLKGKAELEIQTEVKQQIERVKKSLQSNLKLWVERKGKI